jgi:hypothetical protein
MFIVGTAQRGPTDDYRLVRSVSEVESVFGDYDSDSTLFQHLQTFFEEGGQQAYVVRVVDTTAPAASAATTLTFLDSNDDPAFTVDPVGAGSWADDGNLTVEVYAGIINETVRVKVTYREEIIYISGDLTSNKAIKEALEANVGNYVTATYDDTVGIAVADEQTFTGGYSASAGVTETMLVTALNKFVPELGAGVVCIPEYSGFEIWDGIQQHCLDNNRIGFCSTPYTEGDVAATSLGVVKDALLGDFDGGSRQDGPYYGTTDVAKTNASVLAFYWPHVKVPNGTGGTRAISPESFAAAARARAHLQVGPWRPGAGIISAGRFATDLVFPVNSVLGEEANDSRINALRKIDGTVRVYGARSVSADEDNWRYITYRDVINYVVVQASARLEPYVFGVIDSRNSIFGNIAAEMVNLLEPLRRAGGIYEGRDERGNVVDRGYTVDVSEALNPTQQLAAGTVTAKVALRVSSVGEIVNLLISKSGLTSAV